MDYKEAAETLEREAREAGLELTSKQVPWSRSRNKNEKQPTVEWHCELRKGGRLILGFDYSQGIAHLRGYQYTDGAHVGYWRSVEGDARIRHVCEGGIDRGGRNGIGPGPLSAIAPTLADALHSLILDGSAIDYATFEDWANEYGYDPDSRKGERIYRECLEIGLKLRSALGDSLFARFRELTQEM